MYNICTNALIILDYIHNGKTLCYQVFYFHFAIQNRIYSFTWIPDTTCGLNFVFIPFIICIHKPKVLFTGYTCGICTGSCSVLVLICFPSKLPPPPHKKGTLEVKWLKGDEWATKRNAEIPLLRIQRGALKRRAEPRCWHTRAARSCKMRFVITRVAVTRGTNDTLIINNWSRADWITWHKQVPLFTLTMCESTVHLITLAC